METGCVLVLTTLQTAEQGRALASALVTERLAACVSTLPAMTSVYRWQGTVETEQEQQILIKTTAERLTALEARVRELHSYELPEFLVIPIVAGSDRYLAWLRDSTA